MSNPEEILSALKKAKRILIPLHINPDGDSIGSALALHHILAARNKNVEIFTADPFPKNFLPLPKADVIKNLDPADIDLSQYDLIAVLDIGSVHRISRNETFELPRGVTAVNIDHHKTNDNFTPLRWVIPQASATAEILAELLERWGFVLDAQIATCLLTGIVADTQGFRYTWVTPESLEKAAKLMHAGADYALVVSMVFESWTPEAPNLWATVLKNRKMQNGFIYSALTKKEIKETGVKEDGLSSARSFAVVSLLRVIKDVKIAVIFSEEQEGRIHASLRAKEGFNVAKFAEKMGGGGHAESAAFDVSGKMEEVVDKTIALVEDILNDPVVKF